MSGSLGDQLEQNAALSPNGIWLTSPETSQQVTWQEALSQDQSIAIHLKALGIEDGASIAIASHNSIGACLAIAGITYGGYLATPLNLVAGTKVMSYVLKHCKADVIFCAPDNHDLIADVLSQSKLSPLIILLPPEGPPVWPERCTGATAQPAPLPQKQTPGILMYTSCTTGIPRV